MKKKKKKSSRFERAQPVTRDILCEPASNSMLFEVLKDEVVAAYYVQIKKALAFSLAFDKAARDFYQAKKRRWYTHSKRLNETKENFQRLVPSF